MANFIVIPLPPGEHHPLHKIIPERFGNDCYCLENGDWLVSYHGISKQLSDELEVTSGENYSAVILNFAGHWGYAEGSIWEWISEHTK